MSTFFIFVIFTNDRLLASTNRAEDIAKAQTIQEVFRQEFKTKESSSSKQQLYQEEKHCLELERWLSS